MKPLSSKPFEFKSVNEMMAESFLKHWNKPALSNYHGTTMTYGELATGIARLHLFFRICGIAKGDKIAICSRNQANWGLSFLGAMTYGAVPVPILHEFRADTVHHLVNHCGAKALFAGKIVLSNLTPSEMPGLDFIMNIDNMTIATSASKDTANVWEHIGKTFSREYPNGFTANDIRYHKDSPEELAMINYTSGTSGFSKGVMIPYRALSSNIQFAKLAEPDFGCNDKVVSMLPSAHMYGMMYEFFFEMSVGAHTYFLQNAPSPKIILGALAEVHPRIVIAVPLIIEKIYKSKLRPIIDKHPLLFKIPIIKQIMALAVRSKLDLAFGGNLEEVIIGGAAFNPEVEDFLADIGFHFTVGYGMTEGAPIFSYAHWNKTRRHSCGITAPWNEIRISSPDPQHIPGEICVKGVNVFLGYYNNEEATQSTLEPDGWMHTGDMGIMDKDGYIFLRGRCKCMILGPSGQNIYPEELESTINGFEGVSDSLVIEDGDHLTALIYPDYAGSKMSRDELKAKIQDLLPAINGAVPAYAHIKRIEVRDEDFERTPKRSIKRHLYMR